MPAALLPGVILAVDDDPVVLALVCRFLERAGHVVRATTDPAQSLALVRTGLRPALLLSDLAMPAMPGPVLCAQLRAMLPALPALFMSGLGGGFPDDLGEVLAKPFSAAELVQRVEAIMAARIGGPA